MELFESSEIINEEYLNNLYVNRLYEAGQPIWTEDHIKELLGDFYLVTKHISNMKEKKVFIKCITKGKTDNEIATCIEKMLKIGEEYFDHLLSPVIAISYPESDSNNLEIFSENINLMNDCDYFILETANYGDELPIECNAWANYKDNTHMLILETKALLSQNSEISNNMETKSETYKRGDIVIFQKNDILEVGIIENDGYADCGTVWFDIRVSTTKVYTYSFGGDIPKFDIIGRITDEYQCKMIKDKILDIDKD